MLRDVLRCIVRGDSMQDFRSYSELYHFGILGMKWGVRRFQNKDGTLTPEGKRRRQLSDEDAYTEYKQHLETKTAKNSYGAERIDKIDKAIDDACKKYAEDQVNELLKEHPKYAHIMKLDNEKYKNWNVKAHSKNMADLCRKMISSGKIKVGEIISFKQLSKAQQNSINKEAARRASDIASRVHMENNRLFNEQVQRNFRQQTMNQMNINLNNMFTNQMHQQMSMDMHNMHMMNTMNTMHMF